MKIKINRVSDFKKIKLLKNIDIVHTNIAENKSKDSNALSESEAINLRNNIPGGVLTAYSIDGWMNQSSEKVNNVLELLNADYFQCSPPDFFKTELLEDFIKKINKIKIPKVLSGLFMIADESLSTLEEEFSLLTRFTDVDVAYFEIEVESLVNRSFKLSKKQTELLDLISSQYPVLISDSFKNNLEINLKNHKGVSLRMKSSKKDNYSNRNVAFSVREMYSLLSNRTY